MEVESRRKLGDRALKIERLQSLLGGGGLLAMVLLLLVRHVLESSEGDKAGPDIVDWQA